MCSPFNLADLICLMRSGGVIVPKLDVFRMNISIPQRTSTPDDPGIADLILTKDRRMMNLELLKDRLGRM